MAAEYGFVYVLWNEMMPGIVKIGFTMGHPKARKDQLSGATACPVPFELLAYFGVEDPRQVERAMHQALDCCRVNSGREFFKCSMVAVQNLVRKYADPHDDMCNTSALDNECYFEESDYAKKWPVDYFFSQSADPIFWPEHRGGLD